jgi:hypothetical protein
LNSSGPTTGTAETQPKAHHHHANNNRQRQVLFGGEFHVHHIFYKCFVAMTIFFNSSSMVLPWEEPKLSPQTEFGLPPCTTALTTSIGSGGYIFVVSF